MGLEIHKFSQRKPVCMGLCVYGVYEQKRIKLDSEQPGFCFVAPSQIQVHLL